MTDEQRERIATWLATLPEVKWDRLIDMGAYVRVYGWLPRDDGRADFVLFDFDEAEGTVAFTTSSAARSVEFAERLFPGEHEHVACQRVADVLGDLLG